MLLSLVLLSFIFCTWIAQWLQQVSHPIPSHHGANGFKSPAKGLHMGMNEAASGKAILSS